MSGGMELDRFGLPTQTAKEMNWISANVPASSGMTVTLIVDIMKMPGFDATLNSLHVSTNVKFLPKFRNR